MMNRKQFAELIRNPGLTDKSSIPMLEDLVERYPFCQAAQILYTYNLYRADNSRYSVQLKIAAAYAGDRRVLKTLIQSAQQMVDLQFVEPVVGPVSENEDQEQKLVVTWEFPPSVPKTIVPVITVHTGSHDRMTQEELLAIVKKRLAEINGTYQPESLSDEEKDQTSLSCPASSSALSASSKKALIEEFIRDEPRIPKPQATFFNPSDSAIRSNYDDEGIVSETLAQLYAEQGNIPKAIHIYQKLSLLNQEKSRYFAAQIEKLSS